MLGLIIYMACDNEAKSKLREAETEGRLTMKDMDDECTRTHIVEQILSEIQRSKLITR